MAAHFNKADAISQKGSSLEADDGCHFYSGVTGGPHLAKQNLFGGGGIDVCDSGVSLTSFGCEVMPSLGISDPAKPQLTNQQTSGTLVSIGYTSFGGPEDILVDSALEGKMEGLDISCCEAVTTTTSSVETTPCPVTQQVDPRRAFVDRLNLYFTPDDDGDTKLHLAVISRNMDAMIYLIITAASCATSLLDLQNHEFRQTALHLAIITDQPAIVRLLVNCGASSDIRDRHGNTALHLACSRGLVGCIVEMMREFSVEERAQLEQYCHNAGLPPLQLPAFHLPNLNAVDYEGRSCLHMVESWKSNAQLASQRLPAIQFLVRSCGANINIQEGKSGHSLLHLAVKQADTELFNYLLKVPSVDVNLTTYSRLTALDIADMLARYDMVRQLTSVAGQHSADYVPDSGSDSDDMDEYDDLVIAGQKLTLNSWH